MTEIKEWFLILLVLLLLTLGVSIANWYRISDLNKKIDNMITIQKLNSKQLKTIENFTRPIGLERAE